MKSEKNLLTPVIWKGGNLYLLDQRKLPQSKKFVKMRKFGDVVRAIKNMMVRGAPAIGITAAYGIALWAKHFRGDEKRFFRELEKAIEALKRTRPTAVNLFWAVERMRKSIAGLHELGKIKKKLEEEALSIHREDVEANKKIGEYGAELIEDGWTILTHCNAGALATGGYGTALGVIRRCVEMGKKIKVIACETRPLLQGARLTAWELWRDGIEVNLITDSSAGFIMKKGMVNAVIVGADRIALNGDFANKIGTYSLAVLAKEHGIPFYVAAPSSTFDPCIKGGSEIPVEERGEEEVKFIGKKKIAPDGVKIYNFAFDITPASCVTAFITDKGVIHKPFIRIRDIIQCEKK